MNFFICNRYDSQKENLFIISSKTPFIKDKIKKIKNPFLKNLLLEEINNLNKISISNIDLTNNQNSDESEDLQVIDYPSNNSQPFIKLGNRLSNKLKYNSFNSSIDSDKTYFNCFNFDNVEEKNQVRMNRNKNNNNISGIKESYTRNKNLLDKFDNKLKLDDSQIDVDDTIKGEDNINITKLKSLNKKLGNKKHSNNIKIISNNNIKKGGYVNKISLNNTNKLNINNKKYNNNTFIKKNPKINLLNKSLSKKKKNNNNNSMNFNSKTEINSLINTNDPLNNTYKINKNKLKQNIKQKIFLNKSKNNNRIINTNYSNDDIRINNYKHKNVYDINNNINNSKDIIRSIKRKIQKDLVYGTNNNINNKKK